MPLSPFNVNFSNYSFDHIHLVDHSCLRHGNLQESLLKQPETIINTTGYAKIRFDDIV